MKRLLATLLMATAIVTAVPTATYAKNECEFCETDKYYSIKNGTVKVSDKIKLLKAIQVSTL